MSRPMRFACVVVVGLSIPVAGSVTEFEREADASPAGTGPPVNSVFLEIVRIDGDFIFPLDEFRVEIDVEIPNVVDVTSVTVSTTGGLVLPLRQSKDRMKDWFAEEGLADLATVKTKLNGTWTIAIVAVPSSITTFTLNAQALVDGSFYDTPTVVCPANDSIDVPPNVVFSWTDPTRGVSPVVLLVTVVGPGEIGQNDNSLDGTPPIDATSWSPPLDIELGENRFLVGYRRFDGRPYLATPLITSDTIVWGDHSLAPPGYPRMTPLLVPGSTTTISFDVSVACPWDCDGCGDGNANVKDLLALLGQWDIDSPVNCKGGGACDFDDNGCVDVVDLLKLLGAYATDPSGVGCP